MTAARELSASVGRAPACRALEVPRATFYRALAPASAPAPVPAPTRQPPARALDPAERQAVLDQLNSPRFLDLAPGQVHAALLDQGTYLCSPRTMYRLLDRQGEVRERRDQLRHPPRAKPELLATAPNHLWSWDITKLLGPAKWTYFYLYVVLDLFSRYAVGWMVVHRESAALASEFIAATIAKQAVPPGQLTVHADNGPAMTSKTLALKLADLGATRSHSRPYVSNDNPFSESHFKTLKYRPSFPGRFGCIEHARAFCQSFFAWYNREHYHSGIAMLTPHIVHHGLASPALAGRAQTLDAAFRLHPNRFVRRPPAPTPLPTAVWINPPQPKVLDAGKVQ